MRTIKMNNIEFGTTLQLVAAQWAQQVTRASIRDEKVARHPLRYGGVGERRAARLKATRKSAVMRSILLAFGITPPVVDEASFLEPYEQRDETGWLLFSYEKRRVEQDRLVAEVLRQEEERRSLERARANAAAQRAAIDADNLAVKA
jgi:hypothetical protein